VLLKLSFPPEKAGRCAHIFASNNRDGVYSHGLNRFPAFVGLIKEGLIDLKSDPQQIDRFGGRELWDGHRGPGMYNASVMMERAIDLSKTNGISVVTIRNNNHWMRGGTYGWQAAEAGCIGICFTNASAGMAAWGGIQPVLGNNPLVIAVPRQEGHVVLDMAMSQYSYGKLQEYQFRNEQLPLPGGYDENGNLTTDPGVIYKTKRALPIGYWKGSGLSLLIDIVLTALGGGRSTGEITQGGKEVGLSQTFICIHQKDLHASLIESILNYTKSGSDKVSYPGENTLKRRMQNDREGIPVNDLIWDEVLKM
jgi:3-dehydro-L-gulonate 2-dehydrogenase